MIKAVNLTKVFRTESVETTALNGINLEINQGEFVAVMGPSGCGKSTLLNLLGLLDNPTSGELWFLEEEVLYAGVPVKERVARVNAALDRMQIAHRTEHYPQQLSGGQQQRVAIARAIVTNPKIILADEPTGNLDSVNGNEVMNLLLELNKEGSTVVMVTHSEENARMAGRLIRMMDGNILTESRK